MTVTEFIERKNVIILQATGVLLVPKDQIQEVEQRPLNTMNDSKACPYCQAFVGCEVCPMFKAGNYCENDDSTYELVRNALKSITGVREHMVESNLLGDALEGLVNQYNKELEQ